LDAGTARTSPDPSATEALDIDALFFSHVEPYGQWWNDASRGAPGGAGYARPHAHPHPEASTRESRAALQGVQLGEGIYDQPRFFSWAARGDTSDYRRYDASSFTHLSGAYYESLGRTLGRNVRHINSAAPHEFAELATRYRPRVLLLSSTFYFSLKLIGETVRALREAWPGVPIVLGGLFLVEISKTLSKGAFKALLSSVGCDAYVLSASGEEAVRRVLLHDGEDFSRLDLPQSWIKRGRQYEWCDLPEPEVPLDDTWVRWDALEESTLYPTVHMRTARSCAFACSFCSYPAIQGALTLQQPETLDRELTHLTRAGLRSVIFTDDTFNVPPTRFKQLLEVLVKHDVRWYSYFRCQYADESTVARMVDSGCAGVFLGLESLDDRVLKNMAKATTRKAYERGVRELQRHGIPCHANFIIGFPGDRPENTADFVRFVDDLGVEFYNSDLWYLSPSTPIHGQRERFGIHGQGFEWKHDTMEVDQGREQETWAVNRAEHSVWVSALSAFSFWSEVQLLSNGMSVAETQRALKAYGKWVGAPRTHAEVAADPEVRWLGERLRQGSFPRPSWGREPSATSTSAPAAHAAPGSLDEAAASPAFRAAAGRRRATP
jgi:p-methyltransferase